jgi:hypothetical protein
MYRDDRELEDPEHPRFRGRPVCEEHRNKSGRYNSRAGAERALQSIRDNSARRDREKPQRSYLCPRCKKWFLTSQPE